MPLKLPSLAGAIRVPRYFAHDFLQRTRYTHAFTASWPSLFVAAPHTRSSLHVDQWQGNFWMAMVKGTKRWTLFHADDVGLCSPDYSRGTLDPAFPHLHVMDDARRRAKREEGTHPAASESEFASGSGSESGSGDGTRFGGPYPFLPYARRWDVDLGPGEVLFVPGGFPHVVHNLDVTVSFAGNYVDESNLDRALADLRLLGAKYGPQMMQSHDAIDEVWFDPEDEVMVEETLERGRWWSGTRITEVERRARSARTTGTACPRKRTRGVIPRGIRERNEHRDARTGVRSVPEARDRTTPGELPDSSNV